MKHKILEQIEIPEGISCEFVDSTLKCKQDSQEVQKKIKVIGVDIKVEGNKIVFSCERGTKRELKLIRTFTAHLKNMFKGVQEQFTYKLKACNVHFPMTLKVEGDQLVIHNFLGEKTPRYAKILPNVDAQVKGQDITLISNNKEAVGQTAANIEKATKVKGRDRRIFQDGIYIVEKAGREI